MTKATTTSATDEIRASKRTKTDKDTNSATNDDNDDDDDEVIISYVEFYSGIGGWTMALDEALKKLPPQRKSRRLHRIAALDHSDLCTQTFEHNFGTDKKSFRIERLTLKQVQDWDATVWTMSPPCQPHTRQHSNQSEDLKDPRSASFLHLCDLLEKMNNPPSLVVLENVIGFESSDSFQRWQHVLKHRGYQVGHFHLSPTQVGLPNDRPRYFGVAVLHHHPLEEETTIEPSTLQSYVQKQQHADILHPLKIVTAIPELDVVQGGEANSLPPIASFLDNNNDDDDQKVKESLLRVPEKILQSNAAWCFDIVAPEDQRSSCFTSSYGKYNKGTGSILYNVGRDDNTCKKLVPAEEREFQKDWAKDLDFSQLRYFSGTELARLFGFENDFRFPASCSTKQQWKLMGNSLNVRLAARVVELGLRLMLMRPKTK
jgi:tRNA (cytosine38-C5)-methyltransferase